MSISNINSLPLEILVNIFSRLPEDHAAIAQVCKRWNRVQMIKCRIFAEQYSRSPAIQRFMSNEDGQTDFQRIHKAILQIEAYAHHYPERDLSHVPPDMIYEGNIEGVFRQAAQHKTDQDLIIFFEALRSKFYSTPVLPQDLSIAQKVVCIRKWMKRFYRQYPVILPRGPIDTHSLEFAIRQADQRKTDLNLIIFFKRLYNFIHAPELPQDLSITQKAIFIREWMNTHQEVLNEVVYFDLDGNGLNEIPREIGNLVNLQELHLERNQLTEIPHEIGHLVNLRTLSLDRNKLTELPHEISNLVNLFHLGLSQNQLTAGARAIIGGFQQHHPECSITIDPPVIAPPVRNRDSSRCVYYAIAIAALAAAVFSAYAFSNHTR